MPTNTSTKFAANLSSRIAGGAVRFRLTRARNADVHHTGQSQTKRFGEEPKSYLLGDAALAECASKSLRETMRRGRAMPRIAPSSES